MEVLEPIEHSVLEKALDDEPMKEMSVLEPLEHSVLWTALNGVPMEGAPLLEPIEHTVLENLWTVDIWRGYQRIWNS